MLALKVIGLSLLQAFVLMVLCLFGGLFLYIALDPIMPDSNLASFMLFFVPFSLVGVPSVIASSWLVLKGQRLWLVAVLFGTNFVLGTLGFAGFMVGAMGI